MLSWTSTSLGLTGLLAGPKAFHEIVESERHTRYIFLSFVCFETEFSV